MHIPKSYTSHTQTNTQTKLVHTHTQLIQQSYKHINKAYKDIHNSIKQRTHRTGIYTKIQTQRNHTTTLTNLNHTQTF